MSPRAFLGWTFSAVLLTAPLNAVGLLFLWRWFVERTFHVPGLALWQAAGLSLLVSYITWRKPADDSKPTTDDERLKEFAEGVVGVLLKVPVCLGFGALFYLLSGGAL